MCRAGKVVDEDRPADADLVAQQPRAPELVVNAAMRADILAGVRLPGVDEVPGDVLVPQ